MDQDQLRKLCAKLRAVPLKDWFDAYAGRGYSAQIGDFRFDLECAPKDPRYDSPLAGWPSGIEYVLTLRVSHHDHGVLATHRQTAMDPPFEVRPRAPSLFNIYASIPQRRSQEVLREAMTERRSVRRQLDELVES